jgi:hypothetical protein
MHFSSLCFRFHGNIEEDVCDRTLEVPYGLWSLSSYPSFSFVSKKIKNLPLILHLLAFTNYKLQLGDELIPIKYSLTQLTSSIYQIKRHHHKILLFHYSDVLFSKCSGTQLIRLKSLRISRVSPC